MSEWAPCHLCGQERESHCACTDPKCADYVPLATVAPTQPTPEERQRLERAEAVEELERAISICCNSGIFREYEIKLQIETARTLRSHIDDLNTADQQCALAEKAYEQCDAKLKDALVEVENLRRWKQEMLTVERWWKDVDDAVRKHPTAKLGAHVSHEALRLITERDSVFDLLRDILDTLHYTMPHLAVGGDVRPKIRPLIAALEKILPPITQPTAALK